MRFFDFIMVDRSRFLLMLLLLWLWLVMELLAEDSMAAAIGSISILRWLRIVLLVLQ